MALAAYCNKCNVGNNQQIKINKKNGWMLTRSQPDTNSKVT